MSQKPANTARIRVPVEFWPALRFAMPAALESTYDEEVLADAPLVYWPLGDSVASSRAADLSPNGVVGQYTAAVVQDAPLAPGLPPSLVCPVASAYVVSDSIALTGDRTLTCWYRPPFGTADASIGPATPLGYLAWHGHINGLGVNVQGTTVQAVADGGITADALVATSTNQAWFVAGVATTGSVGIYLQGSYFATGIAGAPTGGTFPVAAGAGVAGVRLGPVAVFASAVAPVRLAAHYAAGIRAAPNRGGIGFTPETVRFEGPPQRWHFPATCAPRGTEDWTLFVVCQLSYTGLSQMLLHCTAAPIAAAGFQLDWTTTSGFRWLEVGDTGTTVTLVWSAAPSARHVLAITHTGGLRPVAVTYADGVLGTFGFGQTWSVQNTLTLGTYTGPISVCSGAIEQVYLVGSAMAQADVIKVTAALA